MALPPNDGAGCSRSRNSAMAPSSLLELPGWRWFWLTSRAPAMAGAGKPRHIAAPVSDRFEGSGVVPGRRILKVQSSGLSRYPFGTGCGNPGPCHLSGGIKM